MASLSEIEKLLDRKLLPVIEMEKTIKRIEKKMGELEEENSALRKTVVDLAEQMDSLENQDRRNNIVIYGMQEGAEIETWTDTEEKVIRLFEMEGVTIDPHKIERTHRLHSTNRPRPVIVKFNEYKEKEKALKEGRRKFGGDREVRIAEDVTKRARQQRKILRPIQEALFKGRHKVFYRRDDLYAGEVVFRTVPELDITEALTKEGIVRVNTLEDAISLIRKRPLSSPMAMASDSQKNPRTEFAMRGRSGRNDRGMSARNNHET